MAFIPKNAIWYIAEIAVETNVEDDPRNIVHFNYLLVRADSPEEAYEKALRLGAEHESTYLNSDKKTVKSVFRGLRNLNVVHEELEDGAELLYEEKIDLTREQLDALIRPKELLAVFKPIERSAGPDYGSEGVRQEARILQQGKL